MSKSIQVNTVSSYLKPYPIKVMRIPAHGASQGQHRHDFQELVIIVKGQGKHWVENEIYPIESGDVFVLLGDMKHCYPETDNLFLINILYDMRQINFPLADVGTLPGYHALFRLEPKIRSQRKLQNRLRLSVEQLTEALRLVAELEDELGSDRQGHYFFATAHLMRLIGFLARCYSQMETGGNRPLQHFSRLLGYMEKNYANPLGVKDLMRVAHMSQTTLMRTFKQLMGRSPIEHLIRLRISKARQLLRHTDQSLADIAVQVGFRDSNYLSRQFHKVTGVSPREFRQQRHLR
jgi:AraC-like DNA-binding protein